MTHELMVLFIIIAGTYIATRIAGMNKDSTLDKEQTKEENKPKVQTVGSYGRKHH